MKLIVLVVSFILLYQTATYPDIRSKEVKGVYGQPGYEVDWFTSEVTHGWDPSEGEVKYRKTKAPLNPSTGYSGAQPVNPYADVEGERQAAEKKTRHMQQ